MVNITIEQLTYSYEEDGKRRSSPPGHPALDGVGLSIPKGSLREWTTSGEAPV